MCGAMNHHLFLDETKGWMVCEKCNSQVQMLGFEKKVLIPVFSMKSLTEAARNGHI